MDPVDETLRPQVVLCKHIYASMDLMALKCAVELRIPDIIHSEGPEPVTLARIAARIPSPSPEAAYLARVMRFLVHRKVFSAHRDGGETLYGLAPVSRLLLQEAGHRSLAPVVRLMGHPTMMSPWHKLGDCIKDGASIPFQKDHGYSFWELASRKPEFNRMFHDAQACTNEFMMEAIVAAYKDGFQRVGTLVDVGGGTGSGIAEIVRSHPHIKGINFDRPHVLAEAPACSGVAHVGGDMFEAIPSADAVFMKWILHDWDDEDCVRILKSCRKALPKENGVAIIADIVLRPDGDGLLYDVQMGFDLTMMILTGGKERSEPEWKKILEEGGFPRYNIIQTASLLSIIEAFPL
ncbi:hypothetical protein BT93_K1812 [Corymbia citriodora subsp. variegata]|nr:hypothetical protein BT93_K1812 [Corymbia citriodora subsp. variegata]